MIGNGQLQLFGGGATICIFSEWGVTGKFFGLLLACNWVLLVQADRRWTYWHFGKAIQRRHRQDCGGACRREHPPGWNCTIVSLAALGPPREGFLKSR